MNRNMIRCTLALCCVALLASGCAKKKLVTQEELVAPTIDQTVQIQKQAEQVQESSVMKEPIGTQSIEDTTTAIKEENIDQMAKMSAQETELVTIYFDFDSAVLTQASRDILNINTGILLKNNFIKIRIEGHCDERGSDEYNIALGERRAKAAMNYLVTLGVQQNRLSIISYGEEKPADPEHDEAAWDRNRRDEFVIVK